MKKLTLEQTDKILQNLKEINMEVILTINLRRSIECIPISEEYFNRKVNEALGVKND